MATITLDIKSELPTAIRWTDTMTKQLPFAISQALNASAFDARTALNGSTNQFFKQPTRFTQTAFLVKKTNKRELEAQVFANDKQGADRARYLRFGIQGGQRPQKGFERKFLAEVVGSRQIPRGAQLVPTNAIRRNAQGNVSLATIKRIQQGLANPGPGGFFVGTPKGGDRPAGVYRRSKQRITPYFIASNERASYRSRLPMAEIGSKAVQRRFGVYLRSSLEKALATAR